MHIDALFSPLPEAVDLSAAAVRAQVDPADVLVVLDDDPTGTQSVAGLPVLTRWERTDLDGAFATGAAAVYVLTNTRSLDEEAAAGASRRMMDFLQEFTEGSRRKGGARRRSAAPTSTPARRIATAAPASAGIRKRAQPATQGERGRRRAAGGR